MIFDILSFFEAELNKYLDLKLKSNSTDPRIKLGNVARALDPGTGGKSLDGVGIITLVNVEEDRVARQHENFIKTDTVAQYKNPPILLNLFVLFSVNKDEYSEGLKWLAHIIQYFQHQNSFTPLSHPNLNPKIQKIIVELYSLNFEQINHLWSTLGGKYLPSVLYKVRQVTIDENAITGESGLIQEIELRGSFSK